MDLEPVMWFEVEFNIPPEANSDEFKGKAEESVVWPQLHRCRHREGNAWESTETVAYISGAEDSTAGPQ